eukprot:gene4251-3073_t
MNPYYAVCPDTLNGETETPRQACALASVSLSCQASSENNDFCSSLFFFFFTRWALCSSVVYPGRLRINAHPFSSTLRSLPDALRGSSTSRSTGATHLSPDRFTSLDTAAHSVGNEDATETPAKGQHRSAALCREIRRVAEEETRAEVERDARDGAAAVPPLPPLGWRVVHEPGSRSLVLERCFRDTAATPRFRSVLEEALNRQRGQKPLHNEKQRAPTAPAAAGRLSTHVRIRAPFRVRDLSLLDPKIPITEWTCLDAFVTKKPPVSGSVPPQPVQQQIWDDRECMLLRLASVESEVRLRAVQFLSRPVARRIRETAAFGAGDPLWCSAAARQRHPVGAVASSPDVLLGATPFGELGRAMSYHGPYLSNISAELRDALLTYIASELGITGELVEYVCQMQYFAEQEEYMSWLARLGLLAESLGGSHAATFSIDETDAFTSETTCICYLLTRREVRC